MTTLQLRITGMTCDHCAKSTEEALNALAGVKASVSFDEGLAKVESAGEVDPGQLLKAVESKAMAPACWTMRVKS